MSEQCQRCGEEGEDRRTLWMACLYEMRELPVPFKLSAIKGVYQEQVGTKRLETLDTDVPVFETMPEEEEQQYRFYNLRVCKSCRAEWMQAIATWFNAQPVKRHPTGTGVYGRKHGAVYEMSEEEIKERWPDVELVSK